MWDYVNKTVIPNPDLATLLDVNVFSACCQATGQIHAPPHSPVRDPLRRLHRRIHH